MTRLQRALVIGSGIAGPVVALALQRAGIDAVIYEGHHEARDAEGSFLGLAPNGRDVLATLGIRDEIDAVGIETTEIALLNHSGKRLGVSPQPVLTVKRGLLTGALRQAAEARGIHVEYCKRLVDISDCGRDGVVAHFADGSQARGDFLIGADGIRSRTRRTVMPDAPEPRFTGIVSSGGYTHLPGVPSSAGTMFMTFALHGFFGYQVLDSGEIYWFENFYRRSAPTPGELEAIPNETFRQMLLHLHRTDHAPIADIIASTPGEIARFGVYEMPVMPTWHTGRVCLVGDAGHATGPHSGQGGSMAMEDAIVLAKCLRDIPDVESAFAAFQNLRKARVDHVVRQTRRIGDRKAPPGRIGRFTRDLVLPLFLKVGVAMFKPIYAHHIAWDEPIAMSSIANTAGLTCYRGAWLHRCRGVVHSPPDVDPRRSGHAAELDQPGIGSGGGIKGIQDQTVDFGASDAPMADDQIQAAKGGAIFHIPSALGTIVATYNVPETTSQLNFTPATPSATATWLLVYRDMPDRAKALAVTRMLWWATHEGQRFNNDLAYATIPAAITTRSDDFIRQTTVQGRPIVPNH
jgi:2-polyprenyl-6-methoxyphenol hydroxylase-like FAD-dependent oxidoreductase